MVSKGSPVSLKYVVVKTTLKKYIWKIRAQRKKAIHIFNVYSHYIYMFQVTLNRKGIILIFNEKVYKHRNFIKFENVRLYKNLMKSI